MRPEHIAIVHPWGNIDSIPSLFNTVDLLARAGYAVDLYTRVEPGHAGPVFQNEAVTVITPWDRGERRGLSGLVADKWYGPLQMAARHARRKYRCVIAVDPEGLHKADALMRYCDAPVVYYSLELLLSYELGSDLQRYLKTRELPLSHRAAFIIIQDEQRARLMAADNGIEMERFTCVPNAPLGPARRVHADEWHERFALRSEQRVVLHPGSIAKWTGIDAIVASVANWPESWVLVVHTRQDMRDSDRVAQLKALAPPGRVFFSLESVSRLEYDSLVDSADLGIAFYEPIPGSAYTQENIRTIGLSSGKIAYCLRAGVPTIVNRTPTIAEMIERERCGIAVSGADGIAEAIRHIDRDYETYAQAACRAFDERLDVTRAFRAVLDRIASLGETPSAVERAGDRCRSACLEGA